MGLIITTAKALRAEIAKRKANGRKIGFVPTMGALHAGHLSLIDIAKNHCDDVVASIFVNPKQFGPNEDFETYPRSHQVDSAKLKAQGVDVIYIPEVEEIYPPDFAAHVHISQHLTNSLCGAFRPGFFDGVATIVTKLLLQTTADIAVFGEKDFQQLRIIEQLVKDLSIPCEIIGGKIVREPDGLALSSRNQYLNAKERNIAAQLNQQLIQTAQNIHEADGDVATSLREAERALLAAGFDSVDYVALVDRVTLQPLTQCNGSAQLLVAATLGKTRLIDNRYLARSDHE